MNPIADIAKSLIAPITGLVSEFIVDKDKAAELSARLSTMAATQAHEQIMAQVEVNKIEAAHKSMFVAGARPAIMWICAAALGYNTLVHPIASVWYVMPDVNGELLYPVMMGMLGLGTMRTAEKFKGVAREK